MNTAFKAHQGSHGIQRAYLSELFARFWKYRRDTFKAADYFDRSLSDAQDRPPVFKPEYSNKNVLVRPSGSTAEHSAVLDTLPGKRHKYFASMRSSQALAQAVFGNLKIQQKLDCLLDLRDKNSEILFPITDSDACSMEYELDYLGEAVSVYAGTIGMVRWELRDRHGNLLVHGEQPVPDLRHTPLVQGDWAVGPSPPLHLQITFLDE